MNKSSDSEGLEASPSSVSPLGKSRYGRTRKPKISEDFCNIDDLFSDTAPQKPQRSVKKLVLSPISTKALEIDSLFMPRQIQPLPKQATLQRTTPLEDLPKLVSVPLKERKFFKSNTDVDAGGVSVSEVLKIIKSDPLESPPKPVVKPILRTYGNKRKLTSKSDVVESFALPDNPIVPLQSSKNDVPVKLDVDLSVSKQLPINSIDVQANDVNNCTLNLNYSVVFDEMQIKAEECMVKNTSVKKTNEDIEIRTKKQEDPKMEFLNGKRKKLSLNVSSEANKKSKIVNSEVNTNIVRVGVKENQKSTNMGTNVGINDAQKCVTSEKQEKSAEKPNLIFIQKKIEVNVESKTPQKSEATLELKINVDSPEKPIKKKTVELKKSLENKTDEPKKQANSTTVSAEPKKPKKKKARTREGFVSPRTLRSSVIYIETKPTEIVDLTEIDEDNDRPQEKREENSEIDKNETEKNSIAVTIKEEKPEENYCDVKIKQEKIEDATENKESTDFVPGDIMWARIGNHPYWPCLISLEPENKDFKKVRVIGRGGKAIMYHVRFFGDKGRRAWVNSSCLFPFKSQDDLEILAKTSKPSNKSIYTVPQAKQRKWNTAVTEALSVQNKTTQERFDFFFNMFATKHEKKVKLIGIAEKSQLKNKIKQEDEDYVPLPRKILTRNRKIIDFAASECSLSDTDTSSKMSANSTNSLEAQAALYKRNNIFKGAYKGRVCELCEKQEDVLKCKGCFGYFHATCASKNAEDTEKKGDDIGAINNESNTSSPKSVNSVDFKRLSLAEQIDLKMKEIMKKFDYRSIYADSTSDSGSSEESGSEKSKIFPKPKIIQHVTADCITFVEAEEPSVKTEETTKTEQTPVSSSEDVQNKKDFKCAQCLSNIKPPCFICNKIGSDVRQKCSLHHCGKVYHPDCLNLWPQTKSALNDSFICPLHVCHTCVSDNPKETCSRYPTDNLVRCVRCPSTYHSTSYCIPAGTIVLSAKQVVCVRHVESTKFNKTVNTTWCFLCSLGGDLVCCETCPTSVHKKCLMVDVPDVDKYICDDCESGRYPLYDEIVWVKMGKYRWWPAVILFPNEIPENVTALPHTQGEFVVKFFGTHDHHWVSRGRVFLFQEGDEEHMSRAKRKMDVIFRKAVDEAMAAFQLKQNFKTAREAEMKTNLKPSSYVKIKCNKPVGNVKQFDGNTSNATACDCDANEPFPCGPESDCLNRLLLTECDPSVCPAGDRCNNQRFEKREYPPMVPYKTQGRGWGLKTLAPIRKGQFVVEYVGELIDEQEYQRRIQKMHEQKEENYYFLTIDKDRTIDAGPKGNLARFMNHSCQPNCETQKWTVNGDTRVGLFATDDIAAGSELTFNYNLECVGKEKKICRCGAPNCSGFIGVKAKNSAQEEVSKKSKRLLRKKKHSPEPTETVTENFCFVCNKSGEVVGCHNKICNNYYHLQCVAMNAWPEGKWVCPWHNCNLCSKRTIRCCVKCLNSYCPAHSEGNIRHDKLLGFVCFEHDPTKESPEILTPDYPKSADSTITTEETDITSTTSDDLNVSKRKDADSESVTATSADFKDLPSSTPLKKRRDSDNSQTSSVVVEKKKRGRKRKKSRKVQNEVKILPVRAAKSLLDNSLTIQNEVKLTSTVPTRHLRAAKRTSDSTCLSEFEKFLKRQQLDFENNLPIRKRSRARCETNL